MRKTLMLVLAVLGAMLVAAPAATADPNKAITISASRPVVVYGQSITLSGKVSMPQSGQKVDILAQPFGLSTMSALSTVDTANGGQWTFLTKPTIQTTYQARWKGETSSTIDVKVRPAITLALVSRNARIGTFTTTATAARPFAGKFVNVQRITPFGATTLKKVTLDTSSKATFKVRLRHGRTRLRVVMPTSQAAPGYITGFSNVLSVRR
jgi:hypothetical protein